MRKTLLLPLIASLFSAVPWAQDMPDNPRVFDTSASVQSAIRQLPEASEQSQADLGRQAGDLLLDAGDLVEVRVFDTPDLSGKFRVDGRGQINLPVGGTVKVKGLTAEQVQITIEERLRQRDILHEPHVEVFVLEYVSQGVSVLGEVRSPGTYPALGKHTVLDFISAAGGPTASASKTVLLTHKASPTQTIALDLGGSAPNDALHGTAIQPGDRIVVARAGLVYVVGDVGRPGGYAIENQRKENITVLQALSLAQGMNRTAKMDAKLIRSTPDGRTETNLPLKKILANQAADPQLHDGDILFVPVNGAKQWADKGVTSILQMAVGS